MSLFKNYTGIV